MNIGLSAEILAILTAICWAIGSYFEKKGLKLGNLSPQMGLTIRTTAAMAVMFFVSMPYWKQLSTAGTKSILCIVLGGGVLAGSLGLLCFYAALSKGEMWKVLTIAFAATPVLGVIIGLATHEELTLLKGIGILLCISGVALVMWKPAAG
jgi:transporter family protein